MRNIIDLDFWNWAKKKFSSSREQSAHMISRCISIHFILVNSSLFRPSPLSLLFRRNFVTIIKTKHLPLLHLQILATFSPLLKAEPIWKPWTKYILRNFMVLLFKILDLNISSLMVFQLILLFFWKV